VLLGCAVYSHYYAIFLLPAHALIVLAHIVRSEQSARTALAGRFGSAASVVVGALFPWLIFASRGFAYDDGFYFPLNTIGGVAIQLCQRRLRPPAARIRLADAGRRGRPRSGWFY